MRLFQIAAKLFEDALLKTPNNPLFLLRWGTVLVDLAKLQTTEAISLLESACEKYELAITMQPSLSSAYFSYGEALILRSTLEKSENLLNLASNCFFEKTKENILPYLL